MGAKTHACTRLFTRALPLAVALSALLGCAVTPHASNDRESRQQRQRRVQNKFEQVQHLVPQWIEAGGNPAEIQDLMRRARALLESGNLAESEKAVDEVLDLVKTIEGSPARPANDVDQPRSVALSKIPDDAAIVFRRGPEIFAMNLHGDNVAQLTFDNPQEYEHVSVSFDRTMLASNRWGAEPGRSTLWVSDLERGIELQLVPQFASAGAGGVDWDPQGFIYFAGRQTGARERQDVYKIRHDGTGLERLTSTRAGATDVGLSENGDLVAYLEVVPRQLGGQQVVTYRPWIMQTDGSNQRLVYDVGEIDPKRAGSFLGTADPTPSPDGAMLVFSMENPNHRNYPNNPGLNTAHDLFVVDQDGSSLRRLTEPGPISIIPDWRGDEIVYTEINEADDYQGISVVRADGSKKRRLGSGNAGKWIRPLRREHQPELR